MNNSELKSIRIGLGITQGMLANILGYASALRISEFERNTNPRNIPSHVAMIMLALRDGWRPSNWSDGDNLGERDFLLRQLDIWSREMERAESSKYADLCREITSALRTALAA